MLQLLAVAAMMQDYYPLGEGYSWQYEATIHEENAEKKVEVWKTVTGKEKVGGEECFVVKDDGIVGDYRKLLISKAKNGVHVLGMRREIAEPFPWLKFPLTKGDRWLHKLEGKGRAPHETLDFTVDGEEEVIVPAGTFKAQRVRLVIMDGITDGVSEKRHEYTMWYATGVGEVKRFMRKIHSGKVDVATLVLMNFKKGK